MRSFGRLEIEIHPVGSRRRLGQISGDIGRVDVLIAAGREQPLVGEHGRRRRIVSEPDDRAGVEDAGRLVVDGVEALREIDRAVDAAEIVDRIVAEPGRDRKAVDAGKRRQEAVVGQEVRRAANQPHGVRRLVAEPGRSARPHAANHHGRVANPNLNRAAAAGGVGGSGDDAGRVGAERENAGGRVDASPRRPFRLPPALPRNAPVAGRAVANSPPPTKPPPPAADCAITPCAPQPVV